jgi:hypothetical protein
MSTNRDSKLSPDHSKQNTDTINAPNYSPKQQSTSKKQHRSKPTKIDTKHGSDEGNEEDGEVNEAEKEEEEVSLL